MTIMPKYTGKELQIKREIDRINRQIRQAYKKLGKESRLYQQYETLLYPSKNQRKNAVSTMRGKNFEGVRYTKEGIAQISVSKWAVWEFASLSYYEKQLQMLGRMQTVESAQKAMVRAYTERTGQKVRTRKEISAALQAEKERYITMEKAFDVGMDKLYAIERERGVRLKAKEDIKKLSKGRWTSDEDFKKMQEILEDALNRDKNELEVVEDVFTKNQW